MLTDDQITQVWENMLSAETRALYFGDLAVRYTRQKQWLTGVSFFLTSGAAATILGKAPSWVPAALSVLGAVASAYSMAVGLDGKVATMAKLHSAWSQIATQYERLWNHTYEADAETELHRIIDKESEPSTLALSAAPHDEHLLGTWEDRVLAARHLIRSEA